MSSGDTPPAPVPVNTLSDAEFLRYLHLEHSNLSLGAWSSGTFGNMTSGNANVIEGVTLYPPSESGSGGDFDSTDATYWEPWNAVRTYQWLYGRFLADMNREDAGEALSRVCRQVEERLVEARKHLKSSDTSVASPTESFSTPVGSPRLNHTRFGTFGLLKLPPEILGEIFISACKDVVYMALTVAQISTYCRDVALSTPQLWTDISFLSPPSVTSIYLERSKALPVAIDLTVIGFYPFSTPNDASAGLVEFCAIMQPHGRRIRDLTMVFTEVEYAVIVFTLTEKLDLSSLEYLEFGIANAVPHIPDILQSTSDVVQAFYAKPSRVLCVRGLRFTQAWESRPTISTTLEDLRFKECVDLRLADLAEILSCTPLLKIFHLHHCTFQRGLYWTDNAKRNVAVNLPRLITVEMQMIWPPVHLFSPNSPLSTPSLKHVTAAFQSDGDVNFPNSWLTDLTAANSQLSSLDVTNVVVPSETWTIAFQSSPAISALRMNSCELEDEVLRILSPTSATNEQAVLLPNLQRLTLDNEVKLSSSAIKDIVCERHALAQAEGTDRDENCVVPLEELTLRGWDATNIDDRDIDAIKECVARFNIGMIRSGMSDVLDEGSESDGQSISDQPSDHESDGDEA